MIRASLVGFVIALSICFVDTLNAGNSPIRGNGRGSPFNISCGDAWAPHAPGTARRFMIGLNGRIGGWIDRLEPLCADWFLADQKFLGEPGGGNGSAGLSNGGAPQKLSCKADEFIDRIDFVDTKGDGPSPVIMAIAFRCVTLQLAERRWIRFGSTVSFVQSPFSTECPRGEVAVGLRGRHGTYIDALGLVCEPLPDAPPP